MELKDVKLNHLQNLTIVTCGDTELSVAVVDRGVKFAERNNIYISLSASEVCRCDETEDSGVESYAVLKCTEDYPEETWIGDIGKVAPIKSSSFETYLNFCGVVTNVQKIPHGTLDRYTKDILAGYYIEIKTADLTFVLNLVSKSDILKVFSDITNITKEEELNYVPEVGEVISGCAEVIGVLF